METKRIKELVELMVDNDLSRIEIQEGETHILLKRGQPVVSSFTPTPTLTAAPAPAPAAPASTPAAAPAESAPATGQFIRSPMVGTFYAAPDPDSPPFVRVGDTVTPDQVVCLVEAMKVFNEIKAECSGRVTQVLANTASAVEFDQPLFAIDPA